MKRFNFLSKYIKPKYRSIASFQSKGGQLNNKNYKNNQNIDTSYQKKDDDYKMNEELDMDEFKNFNQMDKKIEDKLGLLHDEPDFDPRAPIAAHDAILKDTTWPYLYGTDMFSDLLDSNNQRKFTEKENKMILKEAFSRMKYTSIDDIVLPTMKCTIPKDHIYYNQLTLMKRSLENNGRIPFEKKDIIMKNILEEVDEAEADKSPFFKGVFPDEEEEKDENDNDDFIDYGDDDDEEEEEDDINDFINEENNDNKHIKNKK